jgi:hypothetical protein
VIEPAGSRVAVVAPAVALIATGIGLEVPAFTVAPGGDEPPQLAGPIEPDEDLAEKALVAGRLAAGLDRLDGHVSDGPGDVRRRERAAIESFRRREEARSRDEIGVAGASVVGLEPDV